jgi:hypothetical protein
VDIELAKRDTITWLRRVCPDVCGCGCYVLTPVDVPYLAEAFVCGLACTQIRLDEMLRPTLERFGVWESRGFCTIIDAEKIGTFAEFVCVVTHELGHWAEFDGVKALAPSSVFMSPEQLQKQFADTALALRTESSVHVADDKDPWSTHGLRFTRACVHLRYRLWAAGFPFDGEDVPVAGRRYGLSGPAWYHSALRAETHVLADLPIRLILERGLPAELRQLWEQDTHTEAII